MFKHLTLYPLTFGGTPAHNWKSLHEDFFFWKSDITYLPLLISSFFFWYVCVQKYHQLAYAKKQKKKKKELIACL
jgi:hypothetical protein